MAASSWRPSQPLAQRLNRTAQSMTPGTLGGRVASARQANVRPKTRRNVPVTRNVCFSIVDGAIGEVSPPYVVQATGIIMSMSVSGTGTGTIAVKVEGTTRASIKKTSAPHNYKDGLSIDVDPFDKITVVLTKGAPTSVTIQVEILES